MCRRLLAALLIVSCCIGLSEFLADDPRLLTQPTYSASTIKTAIPIYQSRHGQHSISIDFPTPILPSPTVWLVSTFHRQFRLCWLNHILLI